MVHVSLSTVDLFAARLTRRAVGEDLLADHSILNGKFTLRGWHGLHEAGANFNWLKRVLPGN